MTGDPRLQGAPHSFRYGRITATSSLFSTSARDLTWRKPIHVRTLRDLVYTGDRGRHPDRGLLRSVNGYASSWLQALTRTGPTVGRRRACAGQENAELFAVLITRPAHHTVRLLAEHTLKRREVGQVHVFVAVHVAEGALAGIATWDGAGPEEAIA